MSSTLHWKCSRTTAGARSYEKTPVDKLFVSVLLFDGLLHCLVIEWFRLSKTLKVAEVCVQCHWPCDRTDQEILKLDASCVRIGTDIFENKQQKNMKISSLLNFLFCFHLRSPVKTNCIFLAFFPSQHTQKWSLLVTDDCIYPHMLSWQQ